MAKLHPSLSCGPPLREHRWVVLLARCLNSSLAGSAATAPLCDDRTVDSSTLGVVGRSPPINQRDRLATHHPRVMALPERRYVAGSTVEFGAVGH